MPAPDAMALIALTTLALFTVSFASLFRLARAGLLKGRRADGSPSVEAILHSLAKLIIVLLIIVAQSRALLAPDWPGGPFALDVPMLLASVVSLIASLPAAALVALTARDEPRPRRIALLAVTLATIAVSGAGQAVMSGIAAGRDLGVLLAPAAVLPVIACGLLGCAGVYLHARLVRQILAHPHSLSLALADTSFTAISTALSVWLGCLAFA